MLRMPKTKDLYNHQYQEPPPPCLVWKAPPPPTPSICTARWILVGWPWMETTPPACRKDSKSRLGYRSGTGALQEKQAAYNPADHGRIIFSCGHQRQCRCLKRHCPQVDLTTHRDETCYRCSNEKQVLARFRSPKPQAPVSLPVWRQIGPKTPAALAPPAKPAIPTNPATAMQSPGARMQAKASPIYQQALQRRLNQNGANRLQRAACPKPVNPPGLLQACRRGRRRGFEPSSRSHRPQRAHGGFEALSRRNVVLVNSGQGLEPLPNIQLFR